MWFLMILAIFETFGTKVLAIVFSEDWDVIEGEVIEVEVIEGGNF